MTVLVSGATGFVGSAVVRRLLQQQQTVRVLARPNSDRRNLQDLPVDVAVGDLTDRASLENAVRGCEAVFHVAADYRLWTLDPEEMYQANVSGTRNLMVAAGEVGVRRVVYTSSVATLGIAPAGTPSTEETPSGLADMIGHYKRSKFMAEAEVSRLAESDGLPVVIVNPSTPIGPRDIKPTPTGRMVVEAAAGRMPAYVDTGLNLAHVDDVADGHLLAMERGEIGQRYILGGQDMSLRTILEEIAEMVGRKPPRVRIPHNAILPLAYAVEGAARLFRTREPFVTIDGIRMAKKHMYFSSAKARDQLGYSPRPARDALQSAIDWFSENGYL